MKMDCKKVITLHLASTEPKRSLESGDFIIWNGHSQCGCSASSAHLILMRMQSALHGTHTHATSQQCLILLYLVDSSRFPIFLQRSSSPPACLGSHFDPDLPRLHTHRLPSGCGCSCFLFLMVSLGVWQTTKGCVHHQLVRRLSRGQWW